MDSLSRLRAVASSSTRASRSAARAVTAFTAAAFTAAAASGTTNHARPPDDQGPRARSPPNTSIPIASVASAKKATTTATDEAIVHSAYARSVRAAAGFDTSDRNVAAAPSIGARVNASGGAENIAADAKASQASDWATTANEHTASRATMIAA